MYNCRFDEFVAGKVILKFTSNIDLIMFCSSLLSNGIRISGGLRDFVNGGRCVIKGNYDSILYMNKKDMCYFGYLSDLSFVTGIENSVSSGSPEEMFNPEFLKFDARFMSDDSDACFSKNGVLKNECFVSELDEYKLVECVLIHKNIKSNNIIIRDLNSVIEKNGRYDGEYYVFGEVPF